MPLDEEWDYDDDASQSTNPSTQAIEEEPEYCPLCMETMDATDLAFQPCECGYQICLYCYQSINEKLNGQCPACRRIYDTDRAISQAMQHADPNTIKQSTRQTSYQSAQTSKTKKSNQSAYQTALQNVRIIQRNLVYIQNLPQNLAHEEILRKHQYFGRFGKIIKASVARRMVSPSSIQYPSTLSTSLPPASAISSSQTLVPQYSGYVTYKNITHAEAAIKTMNGVYLSPQSNSNSNSQCPLPPLKVTYGTTKYCAFFIRSLPCTNAQCLYLHEIARPEDCVHKDDLIDDPMIDPSLKDKVRERDALLHSQQLASSSYPASQTASQPVSHSATTKSSTSQYDPQSSTSHPPAASSLPSPPFRQSSSNSDHPVSIFSFPLPSSESKADGWAAIAAGQATPSNAQTSASTKEQSPPLTPSAIQWPALPSSNRNNQANNQSSNQSAASSIHTGPLVLRKSSFPPSTSTSTAHTDTPPHSPPHIATPTVQQPAALSVQSVTNLLNPRIDAAPIVSSRAPPGFAPRSKPSTQSTVAAISDTPAPATSSQPSVPPPVRTSDPALEAVFAPAKSLTQSANLHDDTVLGMFNFYSSPLHARQPSLGHSLGHNQPSTRQPPPGFGPIAQPSPQSRLSSFNPPPGFGLSLSRQSSSSNSLSQAFQPPNNQAGISAATWDFDAFVEQLRLSTSESAFPSMPTGNEPLQPINQLNNQSLNHSSVISPPPRYGQHGAIGSVPGNNHSQQSSSASWLFSRPINSSNKHPSVSDLNDDDIDDWSERADRESFLSLSPKQSQSGSQFDSSASSFLSPGILRSSSAFDYTDPSPLAQWQQIQASLYPTQSQTTTGNDLYRSLSGSPSLGSSNVSSAPGAQLSSPSRGILSLKALPNPSTSSQSTPSTLNRVVGPPGYNSLNSNLYNAAPNNNNGVQAAR